MSESSEQRALFHWAGMQARTRPELAMLFAVPNGGARNKITAAKLKGEGVRAGVPDVCLPVRVGNYGGLWIELKRPGAPGKPKGRTSAEQLHWLGMLQSYGQFAMVCFGWSEARDVIEAYLGGRA